MWMHLDNWFPRETSSLQVNEEPAQIGKGMGFMASLKETKQVRRRPLQQFTVRQHADISNKHLKS